MSKLASISSNPVLREYAQGAAQRNVQPVADFIAPPVEVATSVGRFKQYTEKHRFRIPDTRRGLGGRATEIGFTAADANYNCDPHALDFPIDNLERLESADLENAFQEGADMIAEVGGLAHEKKVVDLALAAAGAGESLAIGANDDVIDQVDAEVRKVILAAKYGSLMGVGIVFGAGAWQKIKNHKSVTGRFIAGGSRQFSVPTMPDFGRLVLSEPEVQATFMVYDDAPEGLAEDIKFLLDGTILVFARRANPTRRDPSFMKTFRLRGQWMVPGSYTRDDGRVEVAKMDWSEDVQVANSAAVSRLNVSLS